MSIDQKGQIMRACIAGARMGCWAQYMITCCTMFAKRTHTQMEICAVEKCKWLLQNMSYAVEHTRYAVLSRGFAWGALVVLPITNITLAPEHKYTDVQLITHGFRQNLNPIPCCRISIEVILLNWTIRRTSILLWPSFIGWYSWDYVSFYSSAIP